MADGTPKKIADKQATAAVDVFFMYPTIYTGEKGDNQWNAPVNDPAFNKRVDESTIKFQASVFNGVGKVYAPRYRQAHITAYGYLSRDKEMAEQVWRKYQGDFDGKLSRDDSQGAYTTWCTAAEEYLEMLVASSDLKYELGRGKDISFDPIYTDACDRIQVPAGRTHQLRQANEFLGGCLRTSCLMASGFGQMKKGRSVPVCHSGLTICQMGLMNIEIDLNSWRDRTPRATWSRTRTF